MDSQSPALPNERQLKRKIKPKKSPEELRQKSIHIRVSVCEYETIRTNAYTAGIPPAVYCHNVVVGSVVKERITPEQMKAVYGIISVGNNLNQLVKNLHRANFAFAEKDLQELVQIVNTLNQWKNGL